VDIQSVSEEIRELPVENWLLPTSSDGGSVVPDQESELNCRLCVESVTELESVNGSLVTPFERLVESMDGSEFDPDDGEPLVCAELSVWLTVESAAELESAIEWESLSDSDSSDERPEEWIDSSDSDVDRSLLRRLD
jgi:hypothetical protein